MPAPEDFDLYLEFVTTYKNIYRSLRQDLDDWSSAEAGGPVVPLIKLEIQRICEDGASFIVMWLLPSAQSPDARVFLLKS